MLCGQLGMLSSRPAVPDLSDLAGRQWSVDHQLVTAAPDNVQARQLSQGSTRPCRVVLAVHGTLILTRRITCPMERVLPKILSGKSHDQVTR